MKRSKKRSKNQVSFFRLIFELNDAIYLRKIFYYKDLNKALYLTLKLTLNEYLFLYLKKDLSK